MPKLFESVCVNLHVRDRVCEYACKRVYLSVCRNVCVFVSQQVCVRYGVCECVLECVYTNVWLFARLVCVHLYTFACVC